MNLPEKVKITGNLCWNDGRRLIKLKKNLSLLLPSLTDRGKDFSYEMEVYLKEEALTERISDVIKEKKNYPILFFLKER